MDLKDLVTLYFERTNAMEVLWGLYITIVLGLLGFVGAVKLKAPRLRILLLLSIAFSGFCYVNCVALRDVTNQRIVSADMIRQFKVGSQSDHQIQLAISQTLDPTTVSELTWFHVTSDILTVAAIWFVGLRE